MVEVEVVVEVVVVEALDLVLVVVGQVVDRTNWIVVDLLLPELRAPMMDTRRWRRFPPQLLVAIGTKSRYVKY